MWVRLAIKRKKQGQNSSLLYQRSFQPTELAKLILFPIDSFTKAAWVAMEKSVLPR